MPEQAKPAGTSGGHREVTVSNWKAYLKNTLQGFLSGSLPSGLIIHNCTLHQKGGALWIGLPSRAYTTEDGATGYAPVIQFATHEHRQQFQAGALAALDVIFAGGEK